MLPFLFLPDDLLHSLNPVLNYSSPPLIGGGTIFPRRKGEMFVLRYVSVTCVYLNIPL